jgi:hypothetical protein
MGLQCCPLQQRQSLKDSLQQSYRMLFCSSATEAVRQRTLSCTGQQKVMHSIQQLLRPVYGRNHLFEHNRSLSF